MKFKIWILSKLMALMVFGQHPYVRTYGISGFNNEGVDILALPDTTYIIAGNRVSPQGYSWAWIFKVDSLGKIIWEKYIDQYNLSSVSELRKTKDGNFLVIGTGLKNNQYSGFVYKMSPSGQIIWNYDHITYEWNEGNTVCEGKDGYVYAAFTMLGNDSLTQDVMIVKLSGDDGLPIKHRRFAWQEKQEATFIDTLYDYTLGICMVTSDSLGYSSHIVQLLQNLDSVRTINYSSDTMQIHLNGFVIDTLNLLVLYGFHQKYYLNETRFFIGRLNLNTSNSNIMFWDYYMITANDGVIDRTTNNSYIVGHTIKSFGFGNYDVALWVDSVPYDRMGYYGALQYDWGYAIDLSPDNAVVMVGSTENYFPTVRSIILIKLHKTILSYNDLDHQHYTSLQPYSISTQNIFCFPNPTNGTIHFSGCEEGELVLYDIYGHSVYRSNINNSLYTLQIHELPNGLYFANLFCGKQIHHFSIVLQK
ncbi:MAG: T9SS type A sorting domain-containing protein [Bacteroidales bacterium]|nr:T9SS type A sorting domain-containing protein [Bacteroidales bacterium]